MGYGDLHAGENGQISRTIIPHRQNYILPFTHANHVNDRPFILNGDIPNSEHAEAKFQISLKFPFIKGFVQNRGTVFLAYTQRSLWQVYNDENSRPIRTTDYEPEIFATFDTNAPFLGLTSQSISVGFAHQSNGQARGPLSRSWNRIFTEFVFDRYDLFISVKPWWRIPAGPGADDNPGIERYVGYGEVTLAYPIYDHIVSAVIHNNLRGSGNKGALELNWSFPIKGQIRGFVQGFSGYGETLLDYNVPINRIGVGFLVADWI